MFEQTDVMLNTESVPLNISYKFFKNLPMQNSYCGHRNFDSVNQTLYTWASILGGGARPPQFLEWGGRISNYPPYFLTRLKGNIFFYFLV